MVFDTRSRVYKSYLLAIVIIGITSSVDAYAMASMREGATRIWSSMARSGAALFKANAQKVVLKEFTQNSLKEAIESLVKGRVPQSFESPLKKLISGPVVDRATIQVFERNIAQKAETPGTSFLQFFQKNAETKELNLSPNMLNKLKVLGKATESIERQKALGVIKELIQTPEGRLSVDAALNLFKKSPQGGVVWPMLEEDLRESIEAALQKLEVKVVSLPADYWLEGKVGGTFPYSEKLALKLQKDVFTDLNIPQEIIDKTIKGITPPPFATTVSQPGSAYGSPLYPATQSGQLVVRTVPAGIPGQPSEALLRGTAERQLVTDPAIAGAIVSRRESDKQLVLSDKGIDFLGATLDALGKEVSSAKSSLMTVPVAVTMISKVLSIIPQQKLEPVFIQPSCLPESMSFEGNSSSLLNEAGDVLAIIGHTKVNGYMPALVTHSVVEQLKELQKTLGYAACVQPVMMIDTQKYEPKLLEGVKEEQSGLLTTLALYIPPTVEKVRAMKERSTLPKLKKIKDSATVKEFKARQDVKTGEISTVGTELLKKVLGESFDAESFYGNLIKQTITEEREVDDALVQQWVTAGGPVQSDMSLADRLEHSLLLFHAYNGLVALQGKDSNARESLNNLKLTIFTVLGENEDSMRIQERLAKIIGE